MSVSRYHDSSTLRFTALTARQRCSAGTSRHVMHCVSDIASQGMAPGTLIGHDVNVNIPVLTDIVAISADQQSQTDARLLHKNQ